MGWVGNATCVCVLREILKEQRKRCFDIILNFSWASSTALLCCLGAPHLKLGKSLRMWNSYLLPYFLPPSMVPHLSWSRSSPLVLVLLSSAQSSLCLDNSYFYFLIRLYFHTLWGSSEDLLAWAQVSLKILPSPWIFFPQIAGPTIFWLLLLFSTSIQPRDQHSSPLMAWDRQLGSSLLK